MRYDYAVRSLTLIASGDGTPVLQEYPLKIFTIIFIFKFIFTFTFMFIFTFIFLLLFIFIFKFIFIFVFMMTLRQTHSMAWIMDDIS